MRLNTFFVNEWVPCTFLVSKLLNGSTLDFQSVNPTHRKLRDEWGPRRCATQEASWWKLPVGPVVARADTGSFDSALRKTS